MKKEAGFTLIELLMVVVIIGILAALAVPNFLRARQNANESSAISSIRTIDSAQISYRFAAGNGVDYADSLATLNSDGRIDSLLASGSKSGYSITCTGVASAGGVPSYFDAIANPNSRGAFGTGNRSFSSNETYMIYQRSDANLAAGPPPPADRTPANCVPLQ